MNIMQIKARKIPFWWRTGVALTLLVLAIPSLSARLIMLPGDSVRMALLSGASASDADMDRLEASRRRVVHWFSLGAVASDLALLSLQRTQNVSSKTERDYFFEAEVWQREGLSSAPADPYGWFRLAFLLFRSEGATAKTAQAWSQSFNMAPYEPPLSMARIQLGMRLGSFLDENGQHHVSALIQDQAATDLDALVLASIRGSFVSVVAKALENDEEMLKTFRSKVAASFSSKPK